jgi:hypothetical protein
LKPNLYILHFCQVEDGCDTPQERTVSATTF